MLKDKGRIMLRVSDMFNVYGSGFELLVGNKRKWRVLSLSCTWRFGNENAGPRPRRKDEPANDGSCGGFD